MPEFSTVDDWMTHIDAEHLAYYKLNDVPDNVLACIDDPKWRYVLDMWADKNKCSENIDFLVDFKTAMGSLEPSSIDMDKALALFDKYVSDSASTQVNIGSSERKEATKAVADYRRFQEHGEHSPEGVFESWGGNQPPPPDFMKNTVLSVVGMSKGFYHEFLVAAKNVKAGLP